MIANSPTIPTAKRILIHKQAGNGSAASAGDGDSRRVRGAGGKSDVGSAAARNSGSHRSDVFGVGAGKQGRKRQQLVVGAVGIVEVAVVATRRKDTRVSGVVVSATSDAGSGLVASSAAAAKHPESLVGGVVLAGIDVDDQLGLGFLLPRSQRKRRHY